MAFETLCPHCKRSLSAKDEHVGKRLACPGCKNQFTVQQPDIDLSEDGYGFSDDLPPLPSFIGPMTDPLGAAYGPTHVNKARHTGSLPESRTYPALNIIRTVLLVLAALVTLSWLLLVTILIGGAIMVASRSTDVAVGAAGISLIYLIPAFLGAAITVCFLIAASELIKVILDIQSNTLAAAKR